MIAPLKVLQKGRVKTTQRRRDRRRSAKKLKIATFKMQKQCANGQAATRNRVERFWLVHPNVKKQGTRQAGTPSLVRIPLFSRALFGVAADACVYFVCWGRKSGAGPQQSCASELRTGSRTDLSLDAYDGTAAASKRPMVTTIWCPLASRCHRERRQRSRRWESQYGLGAVETMRGTIVNDQSVGELATRDHRVASRKTDTQVLGKIRLGHHELVEKRGSSRGGRGNNIARRWID